MMLKESVPTSEQQAIIDEPGNIVITARPGSGKTFTIVEKIKLISKELLDYQGVIAISFTKKASEELQVRCKRMNIPKKCSFFGTLDKFYISQIICPFAKHITNSNKKLEVRDKISNYPEYKGLEKIKNGITDETKKLLIRSLKEGNIFLEISGETAKFIFDMVYDCKLYIKARYKYIFIDEYQDCGEIQHQIFLELVKLGLVGIAVGDLNQAIYAFSNRYSKYLASLMKNSDFKQFEITKNHRCHKSISNYSLKLLGINVENLEDKRVFKVSVEGNEQQIAASIDSKIDKIKETYNVEKNSEIAILCRGNSSAEQIDKYLKTNHKLFSENELDRYNAYWARLFSDLLISYFNPNIFVIDFVEKYVDEEINKNLFNKTCSLVKKIFNLKLEELYDNIHLFLKIAELIYPDYENEEVNDVLEKVLKNSDKLLGYKAAEDSQICIMTLHKSKGLEFKVVFHLDVYKYIMPNDGEWVTDEDIEQSLNLHYVGITRAKEVCYIIQGSKRYREKYDDYIDTIESPFLEREGLYELRNNLKW
ncbi:UvrD-helicase domain-containing protein [Clostridium perfringens]